MCFRNFHFESIGGLDFAYMTSSTSVFVRQYGIFKIRVMDDGDSEKIIHICSCIISTLAASIPNPRRLSKCHMVGNYIKAADNCRG